MSKHDPRSGRPRAAFVNVNPSVGWIYRLESFIFGAVNRSAEAHIWPNGKGINSALVFSRLGGIARAILPIGGVNGEYLRRKLESFGVDTKASLLDTETRRTFTFIASDPKLGPQETQVLEPGPPMSSLQQTRFMNLVLESVDGLDAISISGSLPPLVPPHFYRRMIESLRRQTAAPILVDTSGSALREAILASPDVVRINLQEFQELAQLPRSSSTPILLAEMEKLGRSKGIPSVVVTRGGDTVLAWSAADGALEAFPPQVPISNSVGAGDAFAGGFLFRRHLGFKEAIRAGTAAGTTRVMVYDLTAMLTEDFESLEKQIVVKRALPGKRPLRPKHG